MCKGTIQCSLGGLTKPTGHGWASHLLLALGVSPLLRALGGDDASVPVSVAYALSVDELRHYLVYRGLCDFTALALQPMVVAVQEYTGSHILFHSPEGHFKEYPRKLSVWASLGFLCDLLWTAAVLFEGGTV